MRTRLAALASFVTLAMLVAPGCAGTGSAPGKEQARERVWFEERGRAAGLDFTHVSGHRPGRYLFPEIIGGGAALADLDGDGDLDAYLVQGGDPATPTANAKPNRLYLNDGGGNFHDATDGSGAGHTGYGMGATAGDYDNDGDVDLAVTNLGPNALLRNAGDARFTDEASRAGVADPGWGTAAAFLDHDRDGDLDLFVVNYVAWTPAIERECHDPNWLADYCLPTNYDAPAMDRLYRNDGDSGFTDVTLEAGLDAAFGNGLGIVTEDFDDDGWIDVFVANDAMMNQLWINRAGRSFEDQALLRGCALDQQGLAKAGMGTDAGDFDGDGDADLLVVNLSGETDSLFLNDGGMFTDHTRSAGLAGPSLRFTRFGAGLVDFDNDGHLDLYEANGRVVKATEPITGDVYAEPNVLFAGGPEGRFDEVSPAGGTSPTLVAASRGAVFGDLDDDGGIDVLVVNRDARAHVLRNTLAHRGNWVRFRVLDRHGRDALGAVVTVTCGDRRMRRTVRAAFSYLASNDPRAHFGLGPCTVAGDVSVRWPDGAATEHFGDLPAGSQADLRQGSGD